MSYNNKKDNNCKCNNSEYDYSCDKCKDKNDYKHNNCKTNNCKDDYKPNNCKKNCSLREFEYLLEQYNEIECMADEQFEKAIKELCDAIQSIKQGISYNDKGNKIGKEIDRWLADCICKFDTNLSECECEKLRECLHELICKIEELEKEGLYYAQLALEKLQEARRLDEELDELKAKVAKNCYPKKNCKY